MATTLDAYAAHGAHDPSLPTQTHHEVTRDVVAGHRG